MTNLLQVQCVIMTNLLQVQCVITTNHFTDVAECISSSMTQYQLFGDVNTNHAWALPQYLEL